MRLYTYLNYGGNCRQAFEFYAKHLGGKISFITTHGELPDASHVPPESSSGRPSCSAPTYHRIGFSPCGAPISR
jgi:uncharacterized glyoxalase superfamily protein PhnB